MTEFIKGGAVLGIGALITKIIGALYRIPLTNLLGSEGIGIYQTVFPFYCILLTLSSSGIPNAISKVIAEGKNPKKVVYKSIIAFGSIGLAFSFLMAITGEKIGEAQGYGNVGVLYVVLSPSVFLVSVLAVIRGYHQGNGNLKPTAVSQITEQVVKLIFGLSLITLFAKTPKDGALYATLAVTISEVSALILIVTAFKPMKSYYSDTVYADVKLKDIVRVVLPVTIGALFIPSMRLVDSFFIVNILSKQGVDAIGLYGLFTGAVESIVGVPVSLIYGVAVSAVPVICRKKQSDTPKKVLSVTLMLSVIFSLGTLVFAPLGIKILYGRLSEAERAVATKLLRISSGNVLLLPIYQATSLILLAKDKLYTSCISGAIGLTIKVALTVFLVNIPSVNVYGAAFSDIGCYFVATFLNLLYIIRVRKTNNEAKSNALSGVT